jgi:hypothetical protein
VQQLTRASSRPARTLLAGSLAAIIVLGAPLALRSEPPPQASGVLAGRVIDAITSEPLAAAAIRLGRAPTAAGRPGAAPPPYAARTDTRGQFTFGTVAPGAYTLTSMLPGYLNGAYGQQRMDGPWREVVVPAGGSPAGEVVIRMWPASVIAGVVRDELGDPMPEVRVRALRRTFVAGKPAFTPVPQLNRLTDDRGMYRFSRVVPGAYLVVVPSTLINFSPASGAALMAAYQAGATSTDLIAEFGASPSMASVLVGEWLLHRPAGTPALAQPMEPGALTVYSTTYHPAATSLAGSAIVRVGPGEERSGVDLHLRPAETFRVSGVVTGSDGGPVPTGLRLIAVEARPFDVNGEFATASTGSDAGGRFTFLGVPPGRYVVVVERAPQGRFESSGISEVVYAGGAAVEAGRIVAPPVAAPLLWAETPVVVAGDDVAGVGVVLREGFHLRGSLQFRGPIARPPADTFRRIGVTLTRADGRSIPRQSPRTDVDDEGRFVTSQYVPGRYYVSASSLPPGWSLRSATAAGRDVLDRPLEVIDRDVDDLTLVFTTARPRLSGTVRHTGQPGVEATVHIFPADVSDWLAAEMPPTRTRTLAVTDDGSFLVDDLRPGRYLAVALAPSIDLDVQDPASIPALARASTPVTIPEDGDAAVSLTVTTVLP